MVHWTRSVSTVLIISLIFRSIKATVDICCSSCLNSFAHCGVCPPFPEIVRRLSITPVPTGATPYQRASLWKNTTHEMLLKPARLQTQLDFPLINWFLSWCSNSLHPVFLDDHNASKSSGHTSYRSPLANSTRIKIVPSSFLTNPTTCPGLSPHKGFFSTTTRPRQNLHRTKLSFIFTPRIFSLSAACLRRQRRWSCAHWHRATAQKLRIDGRIHAPRG